MAGYDLGTVLVFPASARVPGGGEDTRLLGLINYTEFHGGLMFPSGKHQLNADPRATGAMLVERQLGLKCSPGRLEELWKGTLESYSTMGTIIIMVAEWRRRNVFQDRGPMRVRPACRIMSGEVVLPPWQRAALQYVH